MTTPNQSHEPTAAYDMLDRFLRNNLGDDDYADYSAALDSLTAPPAQPAQCVPDGWRRGQWDYTTLFNAIGAAVEWEPHRTLSISVEKFEAAMLAATPAPAPTTEQVAGLVSISRDDESLRFVFASEAEADVFADRFEPTVDSQCLLAPAPAASLSAQELDLCRQWFDAVRDLSPAYLARADYVLGMRLYEVQGMRVPNSVAAPAQEPADVTLTESEIRDALEAEFLGEAQKAQKRVWEDDLRIARAIIAAQRAKEAGK